MALVYWRNRRFTKRMRSQLIEAERLAKVRLTPTQGSYNTSVSASAGTHAREAVDLSTRGMTRAQKAAVVRALWRVGVVCDLRLAKPGVWSEHIHGIPVGGDLSPAAARQVTEFRNGGDGLVGNAKPVIDTGFPAVTWEQYLAKRDSTFPLPTDHVFGRRPSGTQHNGTASSRDREAVKRVQAKLGVRVTGHFGPITAANVSLFQYRKGIKVSGLVGRNTWNRLGL